MKYSSSSASVVVFLARSTKRWIQGGAKTGQWGPILLRTSSDQNIKFISLTLLISRPKGYLMLEALGKNFSFCNSWFSLIAALVNPWKWNQQWHTPSQYPVLNEGSLEKKYGCRLLWYITDQCSFKPYYTFEEIHFEGVSLYFTWLHVHTNGKTFWMNLKFNLVEMLPWAKYFF